MVGKLVEKIMSLPLGFRKSKPNDSALGAATKVHIGRYPASTAGFGL
jgi:hypothetical protein